MAPGEGEPGATLSVHAGRIRAAGEALERGELEPPRPDERLRSGARRATGFGTILAALAAELLLPELARRLEDRTTYQRPTPAAYMAELLEGGAWWWWCSDCGERGEATAADGWAAHNCARPEGGATVIGVRFVPRPDPARDARAVSVGGEVLEELAGLLEAPERSDG